MPSNDFFMHTPTFSYDSAFRKPSHWHLTFFTPLLGTNCFWSLSFPDSATSRLLGSGDTFPAWEIWQYLFFNVVLQDADSSFTSLKMWCSSQHFAEENNMISLLKKGSCKMKIWRKLLEKILLMRLRKQTIGCSVIALSSCASLCKIWCLFTALPVLFVSS